jgi:hypothetical protein
MPDQDSEEEPRVIICSHPQPQPYQGPKPEWWSPALEKLNGYILAQSHLITLCPRDFKRAVHSDVFMIDQAGNQNVTDPATGEEIGPDSDPNLIGVMAGVT